MTDPSNAMHSFQEELARGRIKLEPGNIDPDIFLFVDEAEGRPRFSYVRLEQGTVTVFVTLVQGGFIERAPRFDIGYAVPDAYRKQGRAKEAVGMAITEMQHGLARARISTFYVEAIVGADNKASRRVAEQLISVTSTAMTDEISGLPALRYLRKVERSQSA
jgi:RimJ/RimL family protein N-acetyltransferase